MLNIKSYFNDGYIEIPKTELDSIDNVSDGFHTFGSLYHQRMILFATIVSAFPRLCWKSRKHFDREEPFGGGWFIVGISTPKGNYTYHFEEKYWDLFPCEVLATAPKWDGHTEEDVKRLFSLFETEK